MTNGKILRLVVEDEPFDVRYGQLNSHERVLDMRAGTLTRHADWTSPVYRRKGVPLDDLIALCEGLRAAFPSVLAPLELPFADRALDAAIGQYRWHRRLAGDARRKNAFVQFLYKGG